MHAVEDDGVGANPVVFADDGGAADFEAELVGEGCGGGGDVVAAAAEDVGVGGDDAAGADGQGMAGENLAVGGDVGALADADVAVLAIDDGVAADVGAGADFNAGVGFALGVEDDVVVEDHAIAEGDFFCVAKREVASEEDAAAAGFEEGGVEPLAQDQSEGAGQGADEEGEEFGPEDVGKGGGAVLDAAVGGEGAAGGQGFGFVGGGLRGRLVLVGHGRSILRRQRRQARQRSQTAATVAVSVSRVTQWERENNPSE